MKAPACWPQAGKRDRVLGTPVGSFQVFQVQGREERVGAPVFQTEQCPDTHFLNPGRAYPVGSFQTVAVICLPSLGVVLGILLFVIRFLVHAHEAQPRPRVTGRSRPCREVALQGRSARTCPVPHGSLSRSSPPWSRQAPRPTRAANA